LDKLSEELYYEKIKLEERAGNDISPFIEEALRIYPKSGLLWTIAIENEGLLKRKAKALAALEKCEHSVYVINSIALIYWITKSTEKAKFWFERSLKVDSKNGDTWA
jgi:pre-mRNA-processing factor 6